LVFYNFVIMNDVQIFDSPEIAAEEAAKEFERTVNHVLKENDYFFAALSGGSTPKLMFEKLTAPFLEKKIKWSGIHFFWADERMVPPDDPGSNFGTAKKILFDHIQIPGKNIHRIKGENELHEEVLRYAEEIDSYVKKDENGFPRFDMIYLGVGEDGHTASLFPGKNLLFTDRRNICGLTENPNRQKRISLTKETINNSAKIIFLVIGESKAGILKTVLKNSPEGKTFPASQIIPVIGNTKWIIDKKASKLLK